MKEIDLHGLDLAESLIIVDRFLADCLYYGEKAVTIIHGNGQNILKQGIRNYLSSCDIVDSYRPGKYGEGEDGVTIVVLK